MVYRRSWQQNHGGGKVKPRYGADLPSKSEIFDHWKDAFPFVVDWGEPSCWACGWYWNGRYDIRDSKAGMDKIHKAWERTSLQRCHIVPRSLGGTADPSNLFLMCAECHDLAPNTTNRDIFLKWARNQNYIARLNKRFEQELESFELTIEMVSELLETVRGKEFDSWMQENTGLHFPQAGYGKTFSRMTLSTFLGALLAYAEQRGFIDAEQQVSKGSGYPRYYKCNLLTVVFCDIHRLYTLEALWRERRST